MSNASPGGNGGQRPRVSGRHDLVRLVKWLGLGVGLLLVFVLSLALIRFPETGAVDKQSQESAGMGVGLSQVTKAEIDLLDPTPLFLPTAHNAGSHIAPRTLQMATQGNLSSFPPKLFNSPEALELHFPELVHLPQSPAEGLRIGMESNPYRSIGQSDEVSEPLSARLGFLEVIPAAGGSPVSMVLTGASGAPSGDWRPMEWMATIDRKGLMGGLALVVSSGVEECDNFFRRYLTDRLRMGGRLQPGIYRLRVGP
ncbi:MAG TPA: hypothetical protein PLV87_15015 [Opitutaceae bacterium]|nr:hypothetical protein [Opitutaceae bacterium]